MQASTSESITLRRSHQGSSKSRVSNELTSCPRCTWGCLWLQNHSIILLCLSWYRKQTQLFIWIFSLQQYHILYMPSFNVSRLNSNRLRSVSEWHNRSMLWQYTRRFEFFEAQKRAQNVFQNFFFMLQFLKMVGQNIINLAKKSVPGAEK